MVQKSTIAANQLGQQVSEREAEAMLATDVVGAHAGDAVASPPSPPVVRQPHQPIPRGPVLHRVEAGELITAQYINDVVLAVQNLQMRVGNLEALVDGSPSHDSSAAAV
jgi:hypothetical protein